MGVSWNTHGHSNAHGRVTKLSKVWESVAADGDTLSATLLRVHSAASMPRVGSSGTPRVSKTPHGVHTHAKLKPPLPRSRNILRRKQDGRPPTHAVREKLWAARVIPLNLPSSLDGVLTWRDVHAANALIVEQISVMTCAPLRGLLPISPKMDF